MESDFIKKQYIYEIVVSHWDLEAIKLAIQDFIRTDNNPESDFSISCTDLISRLNKAESKGVYHD